MLHGLIPAGPPPPEATPALPPRSATPAPSGSRSRSNRAGPPTQAPLQRGRTLSLSNIPWPMHRPETQPSEPIPLVPALPPHLRRAAALGPAPGTTRGAGPGPAQSRPEDDGSDDLPPPPWVTNSLGSAAERKRLQEARDRGSKPLGGSGRPTQPRIDAPSRSATPGSSGSKAPTSEYRPYLPIGTGLPPRREQPPPVSRSKGPVYLGSYKDSKNIPSAPQWSASNVLAASLPNPPRGFAQPALSNPRAGIPAFLETPSRSLQQPVGRTQPSEPGTSSGSAQPPSAPSLRRHPTISTQPPFMGSNGPPQSFVGSGSSAGKSQPVPVIHIKQPSASSMSPGSPQSPLSPGGRGRQLPPQLPPPSDTTVLPPPPRSARPQTPLAMPSRMAPSSSTMTDTERAGPSRLGGNLRARTVSEVRGRSAGGRTAYTTSTSHNQLPVPQSNYSSSSSSKHSESEAYGGVKFE
ncbi:hypothetical protein CALCODRAFT_37700 [Calocera cornea HHB12733]|uniref:Uncharacterized protein n=1 Tax=Calocera cornea HHB12733 TaxID=1353952 RepID=A0A165DY04_9BASI|nr:hypothetical protein CALCODRAFT_37700 [Calocera cornea HHB12733]